MKCNVCGQEFGNGAYCQHCNADRITALGNYSGGYNAPDSPKNVTSNTSAGGTNPTSGYGSGNDLRNSSKQNVSGNGREQFMVCYNCANVIPVDSEYCPCCRTKLYEVCPKCGHRYSSQYKICNKCGTDREEYLAEQRRWEQCRLEEARRKEAEHKKVLEEERRRERQRIEEERQRQLEAKRREEERKKEEAELIRRIESTDAYKEAYKVIYETAYQTIDAEETKSNTFYYFLRYSDQCTPFLLLCIDSGRNIIYRFRNKTKNEYKDVNISVEELKELLGISEVTMSLRRTAFSKSFKIMDSPFEIFSDHCTLTTNMDMNYSEVPDDIMISDEDFQSILLEGITSKRDNSIMPIIALYLELDLEEIFKDVEGKSKSFYVTYSKLVRLFHKSTEKEDITKVSLPSPPKIEGVDLGDIRDYVSNLGDYDGEEPIPFQLVDTKPQFEGGGVENFQKWISERIIYSPIAKAKGISGRVTLSVIIDKKGNVGNVKVLRGVIPVLDEEAVRVVKTSPKWTPGYLNGKAVNVNYTIPVTFTL